ncbi:MAG: DUF427 domain-containing protein [Caulobacteraceae bacterium]
MATMKVPGPDHTISITAAPRRVQARYMGHVIADSSDVIALKEASYHEVCYFPRSDVAMDFMSRTARVTHCPYKGEANYYSLLMDGALVEDAAWSYEDPYPAMETIRGRLAFYPNHVEVYEVAGEQSTVRATDETVRHTDAGDGKSQAEHWPANVSRPPPEG